MKRFTIQVLVAVLTFIFGIGAFGGWYIWRNASHTDAVRQKVSDANLKAEFRFTELVPLLQQHNLIASYPANNSEVPEIEEADARLFTPIAGETIYLQAPAPTKDSKDVKPRYWLRVEDYPSREFAEKRASEYTSNGAYDRMAQAFGNDADSFVMSKSSLRLWAVARGKRVYALTTDVNLLTYIKLPEELKTAISRLPEI